MFSFNRLQILRIQIITNFITRNIIGFLYEKFKIIHKRLLFAFLKLRLFAKKLVANT